MSYNDKKFNSTILAALLHDIGKVVQGSSHQMNTAREFLAHPGIGGRLVKKMFEDKLLDSADFEPETVSKLISYHHEEDIKNGKKELGNLLPLASLVSVADSYSSRERGSMDKSKRGGGNPRLRSMLTCIFSIIEGYEKKSYYRIGPLRQKMNEEILIPVSEEDTTGIRTDYDSVLEGLLESIKKLKNTGIFGYLSSIQGLLEEYLWSVPSVTINEVNDISLYDHLSSSAAIAAALYAYHKENASLDNENAIRDEETEKFMLITGDISGIQDFIFDINSINAKGLSKELRGRSFLISLLSGMMALRLMDALQLPPVSKIIDAGGKFVILAPNTIATTKTTDAVFKEIISEMIEFFGGTLIPVLDYSTVFSARDFKDMRLVLKKMERNLFIAKSKKLSFCELYYENYRIEKQYDEYLKAGICNSCKVHPASIVEGKNDDCKICKLAKTIGSLLVEENNCFINYNKSEAGFKIHREGFRIFGIEAVFSSKVNENSLCTEQIACADNLVVKFRGVANYLPKVNGRIDNIGKEILDDKKLCFFCSSRCENVEEREAISRSNVMTFQCMASVTPMNNDGKAVDYLAIVKGDVDDLGYLCSEGLGDKLSISRYTYFSRMLNIFFTDYLKELLKNKFPDIYTVYAGGDDFLLIGPWEQAINAASEIRKSFQSFTAYNPYVHLSIGIEFFKPRQSVLATVKKTDNMLEKAKALAEKNGVCVFDRAVSWDDFEKEVEPIAQKIFEYMSEDKIKMAGIYRILNYSRMYENFIETKDLKSLKYDYLFSYDIKRNYSGDDEICKFLYGLKDEEKMKVIGIPVRWAIYKNRKKIGGKNVGDK